MSSAALGSNYDNYMIYIGWFTSRFYDPPLLSWSSFPHLLGMSAGRWEESRTGHYCIKLWSWCSGLQAEGNHLRRWELLSILIFSAHLSALTLFSIEKHSPANIVIFRYYETGTLTTPTPHPGRRGSWRRGPASPPPRSPTGSRTGGSETGRLRDPGKRFI